MSNNCGTVRLLLVIAMLTGGCGPTAPTRRDPQPGGLVEQQGGGLVRLQGAVQSSAFQPLPDVTVEVLNGPSAGLTARTDASGAFSFAGTFDRTESFRASKDGVHLRHPAIRPAYRLRPEEPRTGGGYSRGLHTHDQRRSGMRVP